MANIQLNRKTRKKPIWPWLLLLIIALAIISLAYLY